ncbi:MAG: ABC transporter permease, partial [Gemmatimonadales bacterium]|nr:ABC transporter permease [Gemmatimonadales bacterium]
IRTEGGQYFGFVLVGIVAYSYLGVAVNSIPNTLARSISSGTIEAFLVAPASLSSILAGFASYDLAWTTMRSVVLLAAGAILGASFGLVGMPAALVILALTVLAYVPLGLMAAALVMAFRTTGPFPKVVFAASALLGGVYYPTHVIPSWLEQVSRIVPLTYGLRAIRRTLLEGWSLRQVGDDVMILIGITAVLFALAIPVFLKALGYARRRGTLAHP